MNLMFMPKNIHKMLAHSPDISHQPEQDQSNNLGVKYGIDLLIRMAEMTLAMHEENAEDNLNSFGEDDVEKNTSESPCLSEKYENIVSRSPSLPYSSGNEDDRIVCSDRSTKLFSQAISHRMAANSARGRSVIMWDGNLPIRRYCSDTRLSNKIFIGGVPWECTHSQLLNMFSVFGNCTIEAPCQTGGNASNHGQLRRHSSHNSKYNDDQQTFPGFVYIVFNNEASVHHVLNHCFRDEQDRFFYALPCSQGRRSCSYMKKVQVIPWDQKDTFYAESKLYNQVSEYNRHFIRRATVPMVDVKRTVFVGALHGMITGSGLAKIMSDMFGPVDSVMLDTDKYRYPIGSGRVTFLQLSSYQHAIRTQFVRIKTQAFEKIIQIDPYLYDEPCHICSSPFGSGRSANDHLVNPLAFCRSCMVYYCSNCWYAYHYGRSKEAVVLSGGNRFRNGKSLMNYAVELKEHVPLIRSPKLSLPYSFSDRKMQI